MKALIDNQTITFDTHQAGDGRSVSIKGLHMHKRMNDKKNRGVEVLFPLDGSENLIFRPANTSDLTQRKIINEIKRVVCKDKSKRRQLIENVISEIARYSNDTPGIAQLVAIRKGAERIAKFFSKNDSIQSEILNSINSKIESFISVHLKDNAEKFYVKQDFLSRTISVSDSLKSLNEKI